MNNNPTTNRTVIVIPARYKSTRFPGKPLALVADVPMIQRVWQQAKKVENVEEVVIATDDARIAKLAESFGAKVVMTSEAAQNGTERAWEAVSKLDFKPDIIINFQGDSVRSPYWILADLIKVFNDPAVKMGTLAVQYKGKEAVNLVQEKLSGELAGVLLTFDKNNDALYFSRSLIPRKRNVDLNDLNESNLNWPLYKHIGIYGFRYETLKSYVALEPSVLEDLEQLEQLRALENGIKIRVAVTDYRGKTPASIDTPEDLIRAEEIIKEEGEL